MQQRNIDRRGLLKLVGSSVGGIALTSGLAGAGRSDHHAKYMQAVEIRKRTGDPNAFKEYLRNNGFSTGSVNDTVDLYRDQEDEGASIQKLRVGTMEAEITLSEYCGFTEYTYVDFNWIFNMDGMYQSGNKPHDVLGIYFPDSDYGRMVDTQYGGDYVYTPGDDNDGAQYGDLDPNGIAFEWDDHGHHKNMDEDDGWPEMGSFVGVTLKKENPDDEREDRIVTVDYKHTWRTYPFLGALKNVTIGMGGLSIGLGVNAKKWTAGWDTDESNIEFKCPGN